MHYGFIAPEVHGHLNPMSTLAATLAARGHRVSLIGSVRCKPFAERAGVQWLPFNDTPESGADWDRLSKLTGLAALKFSGQLLRRVANASRTEAPALIRDHAIGAIVVDQLSPAGASIAEEMGLPYVVACNALAVHVHPTVPPAPLNWAHRTGPGARLRNRFGNWLCRMLFTQFSGESSKDRIAPVLMADPDKDWGRTIIAQQPACFDFPNHPRPRQFHYTAPWHSPGRDKQIDFPWEKLDGRPLIYASMGTLQNQMRPVFEAIIEASRGLDAQVVLTLGRADATVDFKTPENVLMMPFAPQLQLIDRSAAVITHAGLNTVLETLARGKPMVCLPVTNDQPGVARRVEHLGAGEVLSPKGVGADRLRQSLERVLRQPRYRQRAEALRDQFKQVDGPGRAADLIEQATIA